jgi:hypothetical protein
MNLTEQYDIAGVPCTDSIMIGDYGYPDQCLLYSDYTFDSLTFRSGTWIFFWPAVFPVTLKQGTLLNPETVTIGPDTFVIGTEKATTFWREDGSIWGAYLVADTPTSSGNICNAAFEVFFYPGLDGGQCGALQEFDYGGRTCTTGTVRFRADGTLSQCTCWQIEIPTSKQMCHF